MQDLLRGEVLNVIYLCLACYEFVAADNTDLSYLHIDGTDATEEGVWLLTSDDTDTLIPPIGVVS